MPPTFTPTAIAIAAGNEINGIFSDAYGVFRAGEAGYLVDGQPVSTSGKVSQAAGRSACRIYGQGTVNLSAAASERYERACRPYLDSIGAGDGPGLAPPFEGGQCPGVYNQEVQTFAFGQGYVTVTNLSLTGPIVSRSIVQTGTFDFRLSITNANGQTASTTQGSVGGNNPRFGPLNYSGGADNCGDPPPLVIPPDPYTDPTPPPFPFNPDPNVDIRIDVDLDVDGRITFNIGTGDITVDPFADDGGGGGGGGRPPGDVGEPGSPEDTGAGGDSEGEAPPGQVLTGLKINILANPKNREPDVTGLYRAVCYIYMGTSAGLDQDFGGALMRDNQFIFAEKENLTNWRVKANLGYNLRVTPYYATPPA